MKIIQWLFRKLSYFEYVSVIFWQTVIDNIHLTTSVQFAGIFGNYICRGDLRLSRMFLPPPPHLHGPTVPSGPGPPHYRSFTITLTQPSVGLLWRSDQPTQRPPPDNAKRTQETDFHVPRTHNTSKRAAADPRLGAAIGIGLLGCYAEYIGD